MREPIEQTFLLPTLVDTNEENLSAQQPQASPYPRLPLPYGYQGWPRCPQGTTGQGPISADPIADPRCTTGSRGFPRGARLLTGNQYRRVFVAPSRSSDACFTVLASPNGLARARLGLAVSRKRLRRAVDRNRIKRIIRESFRLDGQLLAPLDIVVLAGPAIQRQTHPQLRESLRRHWDQITRRCKKS